jgi:hypothetical protein
VIYQSNTCVTTFLDGTIDMLSIFAKLQSFPEGSTPVLKLVSTAFPALQSVDLSGMLITRADLGSLSACSQLSRLNLHCELQQSEAESITTSPLSALHSLRQLSADCTDSSIVAGLTQLTALDFWCDQLEGTVVGYITGLTQLQELELGSQADEISADLLLSILESCKQLSSLTLYYFLRQPEFDALLTHAPQLTSFRCTHLFLSEDRSALPCSWKELSLQTQPNTQILAYIPTGSLTRLAFEDGDVVFPSPSPTLRYSSYDRSETGNITEIMRRSLINLVRCPAWQQCGPRVSVLMYEHEVDDTPEQLHLLLSALAPVASKDVKLSIYMPEAALGASAVQQLGVTLGSSLKELVLEKCELSDDFWPAVWAHLPGLQQLGVEDSVGGASRAAELAFFCSRATRPLQLNLGKGLYREVEGRLERQCRVWGVPQVTVTEV